MKKLSATAEPATYRALVNIPAGGVELEGVLAIPGRAKGVVLFAHGAAAAGTARATISSPRSCTMRVSARC
jgi:hypothetical protein